MWHGAELWVAHSLEGSNSIPQIHSNSERSILSFNFYKNPFLYTNSFNAHKTHFNINSRFTEVETEDLQNQCLEKNSISPINCLIKIQSKVLRLQMACFSFIYSFTYSTNIYQAITMF